MPRARALLERLRHRDRHVVRPAARQGLAHRDDGLQRAQGRRAARRSPRSRRCCAASARPCRSAAGCAAAIEVLRLQAATERMRTRLPELSPDVFAAAARRVMARCDELARVTATPGEIERVYLSPEHARVNRLAGGVDARGRHDARGRMPRATRSAGSRRPTRDAPALHARLAPRHRAGRRPLRRDRRRAHGARGRPAAARPARRRLDQPASVRPRGRRVLGRGGHPVRQGAARLVGGRRARGTTSGGR